MNEITKELTLQEVAWRWVMEDGTPDSQHCFFTPPPDEDIQRLAMSREFPRKVQMLYAYVERYNPYE